MPEVPRVPEVPRGGRLGYAWHWARWPSSVRPHHTPVLSPSWRARWQGSRRLPGWMNGPGTVHTHNTFKFKPRACGEALCLFPAWHLFSLALILAQRRVKGTIDCPVTRRWLLFDRCWSKHLPSF